MTTGALLAKRLGGLSFLRRTRHPLGTGQQTGVEEGRAFAFLGALRGAHACVAVGAIDHDATLAVQALDVGSAVTRATALFVDAARITGLSRQPILQLDVSRWDVFEQSEGVLREVGQWDTPCATTRRRLPSRREWRSDGDLAE